MQNSRKILRVQSPSTNLQIICHTRQIPTFDEAVDSIQKLRLMEWFRQFCKHVLILTHRRRGNVSKEYNTRVNIYFMVIRGSVGTIFHDCLQRRLNFGIFHVFCFTDFVQGNEVPDCNDTIFLLANVINQFGSCYFAGDKPTMSTNLSEQIRFARTGRRKLHQIDSLFYKRKQSLNYSEFLLRTCITSSIIVRRPQKDINPFS